MPPEHCNEVEQLVCLVNCIWKEFWKHVIKVIVYHSIFHSNSDKSDPDPGFDKIKISGPFQSVFSSGNTSKNT